jgi:hypothetical protein
MSERWSRGDKIGLAGVTIAVLALLAAFAVVPEARRLFRLDPATTDRTPVTENNVVRPVQADTTPTASVPSATQNPSPVIPVLPAGLGDDSSQSQNTATDFDEKSDRLKPPTIIPLTLTGVSSLKSDLLVSHNGGLYQESRNALITFLVSFYPKGIDDGAVLCDTPRLLDEHGNVWTLRHSLNLVRPTHAKRFVPEFVEFKTYPDGIRASDVLDFTRPGRVPRSPLGLKLDMQCRLRQHDAIRGFSVSSPEFVVYRPKDDKDTFAH